MILGTQLRTLGVVGSYGMERPGVRGRPLRLAGPCRTAPQPGPYAGRRGRGERRGGRRCSLPIRPPRPRAPRGGEAAPKCATLATLGACPGAGPRRMRAPGRPPDRRTPPGARAGVAIKKLLWSEAVRSKVEAGRAHFLSRASVRALTAGTSSLFLEIAVSERPDLIILPFEPMEDSASDLCRRLREEAGAQSIPILALAAPGADTDRLRAAGCGQIVDPSIAAEDLQETIARMLGVRLRRHARFPVVLPVARGRIFHEFLGYTNSVREGG